MLFIYLVDNDKKEYTNAAIIKILPIRRNICLDRRVSVQSPDAARRGAQIEGLVGDIAIRKDRKDTQERRQISAHVEAPGSRVQDLAEGDVPAAGQVAVVRQQVQAGTRPTAVVRTGRLIGVARLGPLVVEVDGGCDGSGEAAHGAHEGPEGAGESTTTTLALPMLLFYFSAL